MHTDVHALSGIRTHDPSVRAGEDGSCLRLRDHCDRRVEMYLAHIHVATSQHKYNFTFYLLWCGARGSVVG
jgi:hypothetical protein